MIYGGNAIQRILSSTRFRKAIGRKSANVIRSRMVSAHPLSLSDKPLPIWALDILMDGTVDLKTRVKIVCTHNFDITGLKFKRGFVPMSAQLTAPKKDSPSALASMRDERLKIAKEYIERLERKETTDDNAEG